MSEMNDHVQQLFVAIQDADIEQVKQLLALGVDLEQKDENGRTALTVAASVGNSELINILTSAGANINIEPEPLTLNPRISTLGLPRGQNLGDLISQATADAPEEVKNFYDGFMSFVDALSDDDDRDHQARYTEQSIDDDEWVEMDADEDYDDGDGDYDEDEELADTPLGAAVLQGDVNTVRTLLQAGATPNPSVWHQTPVLVAAARKGYIEIVQALIEAGANVNRGFDELPLHTAAEAGHVEVVRLLLDAGADVEGYEEDDWTALMEASFFGHLPVVQLLAERGADVNAWSQGETPLMLAARGAHRDVYTFLYSLVSEEIRAIGDRDAEAEMDATLKRVSRKQNTAVEKLIDAAMDGNLKRVEQYIADGTNVNAMGSCERTALSLAVQGAHTHYRSVARSRS
ncbi:MAG: hypothetical protein ETSY1_24390 [Candidatus Entotheonella factor]|uniref:Uncharacterized protein n=3 Tax=Candidatus Entotheonella TaxID=93171 RepID=W4LH02_ENTF1|nr:MAG: hypothetical protein ETSY1_24390 [Candidatus Entotheonella factor]